MMLPPSTMVQVMVALFPFTRVARSFLAEVGKMALMVFEPRIPQLLM